MESQIVNIIPKQGFELVRDAIGAIIHRELFNQKKLQQFIDPINVYSNRLTPFQMSEEVMINVLIDSANYSQINESGAHSSTNFFVDIHTSSREDSKNSGSTNSVIKRDKFLGMVRYILQDHHYKTIGFPLGRIMGTYVEGFENFEPSNSQDSAFFTMSRLTYNVRINETQSLWVGQDINTIFTDVKLDLTENGYQYKTELNN